MPTDSTCFHVAIIGPSDTTPEVEAAITAVTRLSNELSKEGVTLSSHHWSHLPPGLGNPQGYIDENLSWGDIDYVVGFMREKFGTPVLDDESGTAHEVKIVLEHHSKTGSPELLFYFQAEATQSSPKVAEFAENLRTKAVTGTYFQAAELEAMVADHLRIKLKKASSPPVGILKTAGHLPSNRRLTVEWMLGAQMTDAAIPIPTIIVFRNGLGEEYIFDAREGSNMQSFCNWVFKSMGFDAKPNDTLSNYLLKINQGNLQSHDPSSIVLLQLWIGNMFFITNRKIGNLILKLGLGLPVQDKARLPELRSQLSTGRVILMPKHIRINERGEKEYTL